MRLYHVIYKIASNKLKTTSFFLFFLFYKIKILLWPNLRARLVGGVEKWEDRKWRENEKVRG